MSHANAALTPRARLRLARLIVDDGWPVARAAERFHVSLADREAVGRPLRRRWVRRGDGRSFVRPHRMPDPHPAAVVRKIVHLRWKQRLGPVAIAARLGMPASTVHAVLVRCRINRLSHVDRATGEPVRRYEHDHPGSMIHVDVKKLGNIPDGGGWRYVGRRQGDRNRAATPGKPRNATARPEDGHAFVHTVIDDHSRVAYAEIHDDETAATAIGVLRRAVSWFAARGVTVERVLSDNGSAYNSHAWRDACTDSASRPRRPGPTGRRPTARSNASTAPSRRLGLRHALPQRVSPPQRPTSLAARLQSPPAPHRHRQATTHHPVDQPPWAVHLGRSSPSAAGQQGLGTTSEQISSAGDGERASSFGNGADSLDSHPVLVHRPRPQQQEETLGIALAVLVEERIGTVQCARCFGRPSRAELYLAEQPVPGGDPDRGGSTSTASMIRSASVAAPPGSSPETPRTQHSASRW